MSQINIAIGEVSSLLYQSWKKHCEHQCIGSLLCDKLTKHSHLLVQSIAQPNFLIHCHFIANRTLEFVEELLFLEDHDSTTEAALDISNWDDITTFLAIKTTLKHKLHLLANYSFTNATPNSTNYKLVTVRVKILSVSYKKCSHF